ncbi:hypothetical protein BGAL_0480g00060 [Botrytis galanthina]|uniref:Uncharacterized protein n=1 Tax=Botrytis galanthina TaxID=278940 RepID=A0A4S8QVF5_9HELO|nr:hypothetical protein BGAL_0480g00060 [Botrytis galanthina]
MDTPSTPQSRSAVAADKVLKPITPSQVPLPSTPTPTAISTPNSATKVPLPETPIPNTPSSLEKLKLAAEIPLPETPTPASTASESKVDDGFSVPSGPTEVLEVSSAVPSDPTSHLLSEPPSKTSRKPSTPLLDHPIPTPEISPLKLAPALSSQSQSRLSDSSTSLTSPSGFKGLDEIPSLVKDEGKDR